MSALFSRLAFQFRKGRLSTLILHHFSTVFREDLYLLQARWTIPVPASSYGACLPVSSCIRFFYLFGVRSRSLNKFLSSVHFSAWYLVDCLVFVIASCHFLQNFCSTYNLFPSGYTRIFLRLGLGDESVLDRGRCMWCSFPTCDHFVLRRIIFKLCIILHNVYNRPHHHPLELFPECLAELSKNCTSRT